LIRVIDFLPGPRLEEALARTSSRQDGAGISLTAVMHRREPWSPRSLKSSLPTVVIIGDDRGDSCDPDEWRCSISAIAWARAAIVHGTGAQAWHYAEAVRAAEMKGRCLFVETDSAHAPAWTAAIRPRGIPGLTFTPPNGEVHPVGAVLQ
jgi:hypothetical protein